MIYKVDNFIQLNTFNIEWDSQYLVWPMMYDRELYMQKFRMYILQVLWIDSGSEFVGKPEKAINIIFPQFSTRGI